MKRKWGPFSLLLSCRQRRRYDDMDPENATCKAFLVDDDDLSLSRNPYYNSASSDSSRMSQPRSSDKHGSDDRDTTFCESPSRENSGESMSRVKLSRWKSRLNYCFKGALKRDTKGNPKENSAQSMENKIPTMTSSDDEDASMHSGGKLEASPKSAFSAVEKSDYGLTSFTYPTQERRHAPKVQIALYPYSVEVKSFHPATSPPTPNENTSFLAVSIDDECAQLVVQSASAFDDDDESAEPSSLLGISFPNPMGHGFHAMEPFLGVTSSHPNWLHRQMDDIWRTAPPDPWTEKLGSPSPPTAMMIIPASTSQPDDPSRYPEDASWASTETFFHDLFDPIRSMARDVVASCGGDAFMDDELADIHDVPFDEFAVDCKVSRPRNGIDPNMMMLSQLSECDSSEQPYIDDASLDRWTEYSVDGMYSSLFDDLQDRE
jgi:hypothetical protein